MKVANHVDVDEQSRRFDVVGWRVIIIVSSSSCVPYPSLT